MLTALDDEQLRAHRLNYPGRLDKVRLPAQLPSLGVIDDQPINPRQNETKLVWGPLNPIVHRVSYTKLWRLHLTEDLKL